MAASRPEALTALLLCLLHGALTGCLCIALWSATGRKHASLLLRPLHGVLFPPSQASPVSTPSSPLAQCFWIPLNLACPPRPLYLPIPTSACLTSLRFAAIQIATIGLASEENVWGVALGGCL